VVRGPRRRRHPGRRDRAPPASPARLLADPAGPLLGPRAAGDPLSVGSNPESLRRLAGRDPHRLRRPQRRRARRPVGTVPIEPLGRPARGDRRRRGPLLVAGRARDRVFRR
jgi:hypothetical protein